MKPVCDEQESFEKILTQECVKNCPIKELNDKSCILNFITENKDGKKEDNNKAYDIIGENIESGFTSEDYDTSDIDNGKDDVIKLDKVTFTLTTTENQKNDKDNNKVTTVDLGDCENILRDVYHIPEK